MVKSRRGLSAGAIHRRAFTLVELLVVISVMVILAAVIVLGLQGTSDAGKFNQSVSTISGLLEQARSAANAQDTYVWAVFYQNIPANNGPPEVYAAAIASDDGTDPLEWAGTVSLPNPATSSGTTFRPLTRLYHFTNLRLVTDTSLIPDIPSGATLPAGTPLFQYTPPASGGLVLPSSSGNAAYWVIQFTPNGMARTSSTLTSSIWMGLQPVHGASNVDNANVAGIEVNGLTGLNTIYRRN